MVSADVEQALSSIPAEFRLAVVLADLEDFSYKEIAEIMDCPAGTVMSRLYRGRKMLQKLLYSYALEQGIVKPDASPTERRRQAKTRRHAVDAPLDLDSYRRRTGREGKS